MTPAQFLARVKKGDIPAVCLFLGSEAYERARCREGLIRAHLGEDVSDGLAHYDLSQTSLTEVIDDARAMSLFASTRLILATSAEAALPRTLRAASDDDGDDDGPAVGVPDSALAAYVKDPTPGTLLLFESTRFDLDGEEKKKNRPRAKILLRHYQCCGAQAIRRRRGSRGAGQDGQANETEYRSRCRGAAG